MADIIPFKPTSNSCFRKGDIDILASTVKGSDRFEMVLQMPNGEFRSISRVSIFEDGQVIVLQVGHKV